jgi:uncharacterized protein (DUF1800 family)
MKLSQLQVQHLYWRAGFLSSYDQIQKSIGETQKKLFEQLVGYSTSYEKIIIKNTYQIDYKQLKMASNEEKKAMRKMSREAIMELNNKWLDHMATTDGILRERMSLFWHNHLACSSKNVNFLQSYLHSIRKNSLGNFGKMLHDVSKEPAMLLYLNNQQNVKGRPNENFARELMELFTLGIGNYTEDDIKNAARSFTGWGIRQGEFFLRKKFHDDGIKTFFGETGPLEGEDVINILLENKQTARYICTKMYAYFVNDQVNEERVEELATIFYDNDYEILPLLRSMFTSEWFYDEENIGAKIKSPIDLLIGLRRSMDIGFNNLQGQVFIERQLGQVLFYPPNVAGWSGGHDWIDSSSLMLRTRLTEILLLSSEIDLKVKDSGDDNDKIKLPKKLKQLGSMADLSRIEKSFQEVSNQSASLSKYLLQLEIDKSIQPYNNEALIHHIISISKTPEFQLC